MAEAGTAASNVGGWETRSWKAWEEAVLGFTHCLPCQALGLACALASRCPEYLAWHWAVTKWRCQPLGGLGALQGWDLGVGPRGPWRAPACWSGFWKTCVEDTGIWGCEGLPRAWCDMGPGHQDAGGSTQGCVCSLRAHVRASVGIQWGAAKAVSVGCNLSIWSQAL